jgi:uncharacterized protein (TIGR04255 family)
LLGYTFGYITAIEVPMPYPQYRKPPLRFVALEFRFPLAPRLAVESVIGQLHERIYADFPVVENVVEALLLGPGVEGIPNPRVGFRFFRDDRTMSITVDSGRLLFEATDYQGFEAWLDTASLGLAALLELSIVRSFNRIGLRHVNEIRVANQSAAPLDWSQYINTSLVAAAKFVPELTALATQGLLNFALPNGDMAVVRFGNMEGSVVNAGGPLKLRAAPSTGPFFLVDTDVSWSGQDDGSAMILDDLLATCRRLHEGSHTFFESAVTDELRNGPFGGTL